MEFTKVNKKEIQTFLEKANAIKPKRPNHPVLECFNLKTDNSELLLTATSLRQSIKTRICVSEGNIEDSICIPIKQFLDIVKVNKFASEIIISWEATNKDDNTLSITVAIDENEFTLDGFVGSEFPEVNFEIVDSTSITFDSKNLQQALEQITPFTSPEEAKQVLTCVYLNFDRKELASTDGHRLATKNLGYESDHSLGGSLLINRDFCKNLIKFIKADKPKSVELIWGIEKQKTADGNVLENPACQVLLGTTTYQFRLQEGEYPDYKQLIPKSFDYKIELDRKTVLDHLKQFKIINKEGIVRFDFESDHAQISLVDKKGNVLAKAKIPNISICPDYFVGFSLIYFMEAFQKSKSDKVFMRFPSKPNFGKNGCLTSPVLLESEFTYLLMPVQIRD